MSVIVKGDRWKWVHMDSISEPEDIELLPPTSEEVRLLQVGQRVLVIREVVGDGNREKGKPALKYTDDKIVSILPSPEPQRGLPEIPEKLKETPSPFCYTDTLTPNINKILDCLHAMLEKIKRLENN